MNAHVEELVRLFVRKEKRDRILSLAAKASRRSDMRDDLLHDGRSFDPAVMKRLAAGTGADAVVKALKATGAGDRVYCISRDVDADDQELSLADALRRIVGHERDSIVFPIGGRAAYYENHEGEQYLLHRKP